MENDPNPSYCYEFLEPDGDLVAFYLNADGSPRSNEAEVVESISPKYKMPEPNHLVVSEVSQTDGSLRVIGVFVHPVVSGWAMITAMQKDDAWEEVFELVTKGMIDE